MTSREIQFGPDGRVPVVIQQSPQGMVLAVGLMDASAIDRSIASGKVHLTDAKGVTAEHTNLTIEEIRADRDGRSLLVLCVSSETLDGAEHASMFNRSIFGETSSVGTELLNEIEILLKGRMDSKDRDSYTAKLLQGDPMKIQDKVLEEAEEVVEASRKWDVDNLSAEVADLLFHSMLLLLRHGVEFSDVLRELKNRRGKRRNAPPPIDYIR